MVLSSGDKVFAKVHGSPPWPARVMSAVPDQSAFQISLLPSGKITTVRKRDLFSFFKFFRKFGQPKKTHGFTEGIKQVLKELTPNEVKLLKRYDSNNLYARYLSKNDSSFEIKSSINDCNSSSNNRKKLLKEIVEQTVETETIFHIEHIDFETSIFQKNNFSKGCLFEDKGFVEEDIPLNKSRIIKNFTCDDVVNTVINNSVRQVCLVESDDVELDEFHDDSIIPDESVVREEIISQEDVPEAIVEQNLHAPGPSGIQFKKPISKSRAYYLSTHYSSESEEEDPSFFVRRQELEKDHMTSFNNNQHDYYRYTNQNAIDLPDIMSEINQERVPQIDFTQDFVSDDSYEYNIDIDLTRAFDDDFSPNSHSSLAKDPLEGSSHQNILSQLQELDETLKKALRFNHIVDTKACMWSLESLRAMNLNPGHLVDYPNIIETIKKVRSSSFVYDTHSKTTSLDLEKIRQNVAEIDDMFERLLCNPEKAVYKQIHAELKFYNENIKNVSSNDMALAVLNS